MRITAIINNSITIYLTEFSATRFNSDSNLKIQSSDLSYVKDIFENIEKLEIFYGESKVAEYTEYDGYSSIQYLGKVFCESEQRFVECLQITLTKTSLIEQVNRIERKIDNAIDFDAMTMEEYKQYLLDDISAKGEAEIFAGTGVTLSDGTNEIFTYTSHDQVNLTVATITVDKLDDLTLLVPYHEHLKECKLYTAKDILIIYMTLRMMAVEVQTRVNMLKNYIRTINDKATLMTINYNTPLPTEWRAKYDAIMTASMEILETLRHKYFPDEEIPEPTDEPTEPTEEPTE